MRWSFCSLVFKRVLCFFVRVCDLPYVFVFVCKSVLKVVCFDCFVRVWLLSHVFFCLFQLRFVFVVNVCLACFPHVFLFVRLKCALFLVCFTCELRVFG